jgi:hypothetical protein
VLIDRAVKNAQLAPVEAAKLRQAVKDRKYLFVAEAVRRRLGARDYASYVFEDIGATIYPSGLCLVAVCWPRILGRTSSSAATCMNSSAPF